MIIFDLACQNGHRMESWFQSREDFDSQLAASPVACPHAVLRRFGACRRQHLAPDQARYRAPRPRCRLDARGDASAVFAS
ncbi:MAG: DUF1178 family protein [Candidatus Accumulibacter sp.]|nr:DUF1178 family protein [Accumulibacter sp.]